MKPIYRYFLLLACIPAFLSSMRLPDKKGDDIGLRYDGLYYKEGVLVPGATKNRSFTYFRFYPTGQVVRVATASKPDQVARWISKDRDSKDGKGKYKIKHGLINFEIRVANFYYTHEGNLMGDTLRLTVYSSDASSTFHEDYYFYKTDFAR